MRHQSYGVFTRTLTLAAAGLLVAGSLSAEPLRRLTAEFQNNTSVGGSGEISTTEAATPNGGGGTVVYAKMLNGLEDVDVLYITFSGQGDVHNGSALLMTCSVNGVLCEPLAGQTAGGGGGPHVQTGWYTLLILPQSTTGTNCNDGLGGTGDCHDNTLHFSACARLPKHTDAATVQIKLANLPGGDSNVSFYERATIYIDGQNDGREHDGNLCQGVGTTLH